MVGGISRKAINKLGEAQIQAFLRQSKAGKATKKKLSDGGGMSLRLTRAGTPVWRLKYRLAGEERSYTIGTLASFPLAEARKEREKARALIREGRDPVDARRLARAAEITSSGQTLESLAAEWLANQKRDWSAVHYQKSARAFARDVQPRLGRLPVREISPAMVAGVIEAIAKRGARDTAAKVLQHVRSVFRLAQARGLRQDHPAEPAQAVLPTNKTAGHLPALLTFPALGGVLRAAEAAHLTPAVRMAHRLLAFTAGVRASNIVEAQWSEFDLEGDVPTWVIPSAAKG
jgi:hypothetical protein